jgi:catalase
MNDTGHKPTTSDAGVPVPSDEFSLTVGPDGPVLLRYHYLIEQMTNFDRARIPERQPQAKRGGAFGHFEVIEDLSQYTRGAVFRPGIKTDMLMFRAWKPTWRRRATSRQAVFGRPTG